MHRMHIFRVVGGLSLALLLSAQTSKSQPARPTTPKMTPRHKQLLHVAKRGTTWMTRMHKSDGRFHYGWIPSLNTSMEGDHFLRQAGAMFALARAGRYFQDEKATARATHGVLSLLDETTTDPKDAQIRYTSLPSLVINRLSSASLTVLAIHELPAPQKDLLDKSEQLCNYIRRQAQPDGSLRCFDSIPNGRSAQNKTSLCEYPGQALYALMMSQRHRPAGWKTPVVRKAVGFYHPQWQKHKNAELIPWQTAAFSEAYRQTKDQAFARCVFEMNDWLCGLQYADINPSHPLWRGGFRTFAEGRAVDTPPDIRTAEYAESLAMACRVAVVAKDEVRFQRYRDALELAFLYLESLQYTDLNTQHFKEGYRENLLGGFHASTKDGALRIDYSQHAVSALVLYLEHMVGPYSETR